MCGIAGAISPKAMDKERIKLAIASMNHRGPDHNDATTIKSVQGEIHFVHTRLKIIDLDDSANQPFKFDHLTLIFNGEIYNYIELRLLLEQKGYSFQTKSDTEVLIKMIHCYGKKALDMLEGMWALALYDAKENELILARDRFGEKPLYYARINGNFYFASEINQIKILSQNNLTVNRRHLVRYLVNGYKALYKGKEEFFEEVTAVSPGTFVIRSVNGDLKTRRYWQAVFSPADITFEEAVRGVRERLIKSVGVRLRADHPIAFCLSGGVDSAALASIAAKIFNYNVATFSIIDPDPRYNEKSNIDRTVRDIGSHHQEIILERGDFIARLKNMIMNRNAPVSTISYYVHSFLSEAIAKSGYRIAASGTGADELLTGYYDHFNFYLHEIQGESSFKTRLGEWQRHIKPVIRNPLISDIDNILKNADFREHIYLNRDLFAAALTEEFNEGFYEEHYCDSPLRNRMMNEMFHESIPVILHEDDANSMAYSIENRSPYLDRELFEFCYQIPNKYLIHNGCGKYVLRESMKGILNDEVRFDRTKKGFNASLNSVFDYGSVQNKDWLLADSPVFNYVKRANIENILNRKELQNSHSKFLFNFVNTKIFLEIQIRENARTAFDKSNKIYV